MAQNNQKSSKNYTALSLFILFIVVSIVTIWSANWILQESRLRLLREMEQDMDVRLQSRVSLLTVWYGAMYSQIETFSDQDILKLFASEIDSSNISASQLLDLANKQVTPESTNKSNDPLINLSQRLPLMQRQLKTFTEKSKLWSAYLCNTKGEIYLTPDIVPNFDDKQKEYIKNSLETGDVSIFPVRRIQGELVMDIAFPIFAPLYVDNSGKKVVSLLIVTLKIQPVVSAITLMEEGGVFQAGILQNHNNKLQIINSLSESGVTDVDWNIENNYLPLKIRSTPKAKENNIDMYVIAKDVPEMPWLVMQCANAGQANAPYMALRKNIIIATSLIIALTGIILLAIWWWLVAKQERIMGNKIRQLYLVVNQQKQIMDGVNSALTSGVVLNDLNNIIYYANESFADLSGIKVDNLKGLNYNQLPKVLSKNLEEHTKIVKHSKNIVSFTEKLEINGEEKHFLIACAPFKNANNDVVGVVSIYNDISELIFAQEHAKDMTTKAIAAFVKAIEATDPYLCGQSTFTGELAVQLAKRMNHSDQETLRAAANLSQIGMIQIPRTLLNKAGALTKEERAQLQKHVHYAKNALSGIDFGLPVLEAIYQMYERIDGSGYPEGITGDNICTNAKILAVANTFCAVMRPRSYRGRLNVEKAISILLEKPLKYDIDIINHLKAFLESDQGKHFVETLLTDKK